MEIYHFSRGALGTMLAEEYMLLLYWLEKKWHAHKDKDLENDVLSSSNKLWQWGIKNGYIKFDIELDYTGD